MNDIASDDGRGAPLVPGAHRVVRTLDPTEGPFAGTLVTQGEGVAVRMDAAILRGWDGWRFAGAEHIAAPIDVSRRRGGHDALLPWCTERVQGFLGRRSAAGGNITPGESSTLVVSLLRGLDELGEGAGGARTGTWWLTDGGRPVFVLGDGLDARAGVLEILESLREQTPDKALTRVLGAVGDGLEKTLTHPRLPRTLIDSWEQSMLDIAAPQPLERELHAPERARDLARAVAPGAPQDRQGALRLRADRVRTGEPHRGSRRRDAIRDALRAFAEAIHARLEDRRRTRLARTRPRNSGAGRSEAKADRRKRSVSVAGVAAALVLAGGLLWPDGEDAGKAEGAADGSSQTPAPGGDAASVSTPRPRAAPADGEASKSESSAAGEDPLGAVPSLLRAIADCRAQGDISCADAVAGDSAKVMEALGRVDPVKPSPELVDEYGDVAVVRLRTSGVDEGEGDAEGQGSDQTIVVLIRTEEKWLVRDVYDVADQPG
ncbi:hypothetical protein [Microbacterium maritypicum]|uniref:Uncharacterized protein n=1 Tax=Microbacterium maritypicum TaxID=33918 RepID=A0ACD4BAT7_MICMQ|nr:hypothetical protein [Microbacterium liquefaciens]UTT54576.1 hypothetical protein NMQ05_08355 [Microbacterium liquefaciens]